MKKTTNLCYFKKNLFRILVLIIGMTSIHCYGQTVDAEWLGPNGEYSIKQIVTNSQIESGVDYSYLVLFRFPSSASTLNIRDVLPPNLILSSVDAPNLVSGGQTLTPIVTITPRTATTGETIDYILQGNLSPFANNVYSFTINARFPEGVTCNGEQALNQVQIDANGTWGVTPSLTTTAIAVNPWVITKNVVISSIDQASVNLNSNTCDYQMAPGSTVTYEICIHKGDLFLDHNVGQMNMQNIVISDDIGDAVFISSSPPQANVSYDQATRTVTCDVASMDAAIPNDSYCFEFRVTYPSNPFSTNSSVQNMATLTGDQCGDTINLTSNETCIEIKNPFPNGEFIKYLYMTNKTPGCSAKYTFRVDNTDGAAAYTPFTLTDVVPAGLTVEKVKIFYVSNYNVTSVEINGSLITPDPSSTPTTKIYIPTSTPTPGNGTPVVVDVDQLPMGKKILVEVFFTIDSNVRADTTINNCVYFDGHGQITLHDSACRSFKVDTLEARSCVLKKICDPQTSYQAGDIITFLLRIQNIGSKTMTGASVHDVLSPNFEYVSGSERFFGTTYPNPPCWTSAGAPASFAWDVLSQSYNPVSNELVFNLHDIDSHCDLFKVPRCGNEGTRSIPYYFIQYSVRVRDGAMPGVTSNQFYLDEGDTDINISNSVNVLINAVFSMGATKEVSTDGGLTFASSGFVNPGDQSRFRLNFTNNSSVNLRAIKLVDLLAMNDAINSGDWTVLSRQQSRGSEFAFDYIGNNSSALGALLPTPSPPLPIPSPPVYQFSSGDNISLSDFGVATSNPANWHASFNAGDKNIKMDYGRFAIPFQHFLSTEFDVLIPSGLSPGLKACNDFGAIASSYFMIDYAPRLISLLPFSSNISCLSIDGTSCCDDIVYGWTDPMGCCGKIHVPCAIDSMNISVSNGALQNVEIINGAVLLNTPGATTLSVNPINTPFDLAFCSYAYGSPLVTITFQIFFTDGTECIIEYTSECNDISTVVNPIIVNPNQNIGIEKRTDENCNFNVNFQLGASYAFGLPAGSSSLIPQIGVDFNFGDFGIRATGEFFKTSPDFDLDNYLNPILSNITQTGDEQHSNIQIGINPYLNLPQKGFTIQAGLGLNYLIQNGADLKVNYEGLPEGATFDASSGTLERNTFVVAPNIRALFGKADKALKFFIEAGYSIPMGKKEFTYTSRNLTGVVLPDGSIDPDLMEFAPTINHREKIIPASPWIGIGLELYLVGCNK